MFDNLIESTSQKSSRAKSTFFYFLHGARRVIGVLIVIPLYYYGRIARARATDDVGTATAATTATATSSASSSGKTTGSSGGQVGSVPVRCAHRGSQGDPGADG